MKKIDNHVRGDYLSATTLLIMDARMAKLKSEKTKDNQRDEIIAFTEFCKKDFLDVTKEDVEDYMNDLVSKGRQPETLKIKLSILRGMAKAVDSELKCSMLKDVFLGVNYGQDKVRYDEEDLARLKDVDKVISWCEKTGKLDLKLMIALALECAMPLRYIKNLKVSNVFVNNLGQPYIKFETEKDNYLGETNHFVREFPLKPGTAEALNNWIGSRDSVNQEDNVFWDKWHTPYSERQIQAMLQDACREALGKDANGNYFEGFTISKLNNLAVVSMVSGGADRAALTEQLGHSSRWINRYDSVIKDFSLSPMAYNRITVKY